MKSKILLISLLLTGCSNINSSNEGIIVPTSFDVFSYYQNTMEELSLIYEKKELIRNKNNANYQNLTKEYWNKFIDMILYLQDVLKNKEIKKYFIEEIGEEKVEDILFYEVERNIHYKEYVPFDTKILETLINEIKNNIKVKKEYNFIKLNLDKLIISYNDFSSLLLDINLLSDLYLDNQYYQEEVNELENYNHYFINEYKDILKSLLLNDKYKNQLISDYKISKNEVDLLTSFNKYDDEVLTLFNRETILENKYLILQDNQEKIDLYIDLVDIRKQISKELGYSSYIEYTYKEIYERNYGLQEVNNLLNNIVQNQELKNIYNIYAYKKSEDLSYVSELDLLNNLEYVSYFLEESKDIIKEFKLYGFYDFDFRNNKYKGSYKTNINANKDQFILLNVENNINDYLTLFHEFGHYLGGKLEKENLKGDKFDLDIAEVHSQSLEYIMSSYFPYFLNDNDVDILLDKLIFNGLWTMYSSSLITDFENYVYLNEVSKEEMILYFNDLVEKYIFPYTFGIENNNYLFTNINHIYTSPCYYISYLTSIIPSLMLFSLESEEVVKNKYRNILYYGTSNDFIYVLNKVNLPSPFEEETLNLIVDKIKRLS